MLAAIIFLLLVIRFVLLLHLYAKWFLAQVHVQAQARRLISPSEEALAVIIETSQIHLQHPRFVIYLQLFFYLSNIRTLSNLHVVEMDKGSSNIIEIGRKLVIWGHRKTH